MGLGKTVRGGKGGLRDLGKTRMGKPKITKLRKTERSLGPFPKLCRPLCLSLSPQVQTIGFLSHLKSKGINGPFLVIGPLSTLPNWIAEFERFCPALPAVLYHGSKQEREELRMGRLKPPGVGKCGHGCARSASRSRVHR